MEARGELTAGMIFAEDFEVRGPIARGGMGAVYRARQLSTGRERALKVIDAALLTGDRNRERFLQEARIGARIASEHVVEVIAAGVEGEGRRPWLAMELLDGEDLAAAQRRHGRLSPVHVREIVQQLAHGLDAAHRAGVIHRDLKPENIFIARSRRRGAPYTVKILDFGIAKVLRADSGVTTATAAVGTPLWMAPEQLNQEKLSAQTDIWALGLIVFWALTGRAYWDTANREEVRLEPLLTEILFSELVPASERAAALGAAEPLPPDFDDWFARCVARSPHDRFADVEAVVAGLVEVLEPVADALAGPLLTARAASSGADDPTPSGFAVTAAAGPETARSRGGLTAPATAPETTPQAFEDTAPSGVGHTVPRARPQPGRAPRRATEDGTAPLADTLPSGATRPVAPEPRSRLASVYGLVALALVVVAAVVAWSVGQGGEQAPAPASLAVVEPAPTPAAVKPTVEVAVEPPPTPRPPSADARAQEVLLSLDDFPWEPEKPLGPLGGPLPWQTVVYTSMEDRAEQHERAAMTLEGSDPARAAAMREEAQRLRDKVEHDLEEELAPLRKKAEHYPERYRIPIAVVEAKQKFARERRAALQASRVASPRIP